MWLWPTHVVCLDTLQVINLMKVTKNYGTVLYFDFPLMKILGRNELQLYLEKYGKLVKFTKCVQSISFQMIF